MHATNTREPVLLSLPPRRKQACWWPGHLPRGQLYSVSAQSTQKAPPPCMCPQWGWGAMQMGHSVPRTCCEDSIQFLQTRHQHRRPHPLLPALSMAGSSQLCQGCARAHGMSVAVGEAGGTSGDRGSPTVYSRKGHPCRRPRHLFGPS